MKYFKDGQTVYHSIYGQGVVISTSHSKDFPIFVDFGDNAASFTNEGCEHIDEPITLSQNPIPEIVNVPLEELVPFTFEDRELLIGQWVREKISEEESIITYMSNKGFCVNDYTYEELFNYFEFIDGKTCGREI
jgi:hypothetical protein